jgi:RHS repeat-associated protein
MRARTARHSFLAKFTPFAAAFALIALLPVSAEAYGGQPLSPAGGLSNGQTTYTWVEASGASEYLIAVDTAWGEIRFRYSSRSGAVCGGGTCSATPWQTLELGQYVWYVESSYPDGRSEWSGGLAFSVALQPPTLLSPAGATSEPRPPFVWQPVPDATHYMLAIDTIEGQLVQRKWLHTSEVCAGSSCSYTRSSALPIGRYLWYVLGWNSGGDGPWSAGMRLDITPLPAPTPNVPAGYQSTLQPTYVWSAIPGASSYLLLVDDATPAPLVRRWLTAAEACSGASCAFTPSVVLGAGAHTWYVQAANESGEGTLSAGTWFVTPSWSGQGFCPGTSAAGDFDGDGRTDRLCSTEGVTTVSLSTGSGFAPGAVWLAREIGPPLVADFNGDGKADIAEYDGQSFRVGLSSGGSFAHTVAWGQATASGLDGESYSCTRASQTGVGNFDGDGLPDVFCQGGVSGEIFVGRNTGSSFSFSIFADFTCWGVYERSGPADFDGDGRDDWYCIDGYGGLYARLNDGHSFEELSFQGLGRGFCERDEIVLADLNGDGRSDVTCSGTGGVALSTGEALLDQGPFGRWCTDDTWDAEAEAWVRTSRMAPLDIDGDGQPELVCTHAGGGGSDVLVRRWDGETLGQPWMSQAGFCGGAILGGDFDGNGRGELLCQDGRSLPGGGEAPPADLMLEATNGLGGRTTVGYVPSSRFPTANNPPVRSLVASVTSHDGRGGRSTTTYSYEGARVDRLEAEALGFAKVRVVSPCLAGESQCPYADTWYSQELASVGRPVRVERRDGAGRLHQAVSYGYKTSGGLPRGAVLERVETTDYGPSGDSRTTAATHSYDGYGNLTGTVALGDVAASGDELETEVTLRDPDLERYIVDRPRLVERREPGGETLTSEETAYDDAGRPTSVKRMVKPATGSRSFVERRIGYDESTGNPTTFTSERDGTTTIVYDADDLRAETITDAAELTTTVAWHPLCGAPLSVKDANGQTTTSEYDALCRLTKTVLPPDAQGQQGFTLRSYLDFGDPTSQRVRVEAPGTNGNDFGETYFDGFGRSYRSVERGPASGKEILTTRSYNERGGLLAESAPFYTGETPDETTYSYDAFDRLLRVVHPDSTEMRKEYGLWSETTIDANSKAGTVERNGRSSVTRTKIKGEEVTTTSHSDPLGRQVALEDTLGNAWVWTYDSLGRVIEQMDPDSGRKSFTYDEASGTDTQTDAMSQVTTLHYDSAGRVMSRQNTAGTTSYSYGTTAGCPAACNAGRLVGVSFPGASLSMDYDALGRIVKQTRTLDGVEYVVQREYDAAGRLSGLVYPDTDRVGPMGYDEAGRITSIPGILESVSYDAAGRPLDQRNANGTLTKRRYWPKRGLPQLVHTSGPGGTIQQLEYEQYDPVGQLKKVTSAVDGESWEYGYDDGYRLTTATNLSQPAESQSFEYDVIDRITTSSRYGVYSYPPAGDPRPHAPTDVGGVALSYDLNGNTLTAGTRSLVWNADNLLAQATLGTVTTDFAYDGLGERVKKSSPAGESLYPFGDEYEITDGVVTKYVKVDGLGVIAKRVTGDPAPGTYWLHTDRQGSIQAVTDASGSAVFRRSYRPYGETLAENGAHTESRGWIDQRNDPETGLTYLHARYLDPALGVFLSPDPIGVRGGLNLYSYAGASPINRVDRSGLSWQEQCTERTRTRAGNSSVEVEVITECRWVWIPDPLNPREAERGNGTGNRDPRDPDPKDPKDPKDPDATDPPDQGNGQSQTPPNCQAGITPTGIVIAGGADGVIGLAAGAMAQGSVGVAFAEGMTVFASGGVHAGLPATAGFTRPQPGGDRNAFRGFALGASAGIDFQVGVTNITRPSDLDGPFMTVNLGTPFGSGQFAFSSGDRGFIYTATGGTPSAGLSLSVYRTTTATLNVVNRAGACK